MRATHRCPKCRVGPVLEINPVVKRPEATEIAERERPVAGSAVGLSRRAEPKPYRSRYVGVGELTAYVCKGCGYTELYAADPQDIHVDGVVVRELGVDAAGPYR